MRKTIDTDFNERGGKELWISLRVVGGTAWVICLQPVSLTPCVDIPKRLVRQILRVRLIRLRHILSSPPVRCELHGKRVKSSLLASICEFIISESLVQIAQAVHSLHESASLRTVV